MSNEHQLHNTNSLITIAGASALLGVSLDTIRKWEKKGLK